MDEGYGECYLRDEAHVKLMSDSLLHFQQQRYFTSCYCIMPNHCHLVVKPSEGFELEGILNSWKGYVGFQINKQLDRHGVVWADESYDRIIRDEEHLFRVVRYIGNNPRQAGLPSSQWHRWVHPDWEAAGWRFQEVDEKRRGGN
ncbi:Transposase IS200 like protein [Stieleria maiorica]|uniref:Transposase IS200 like protein n=2 Tax=Stieleria maiorica TaxID=2795974 RepID=A0A5B9MLA8_9BACT|nr:Transposase IS200 like protein [Stieleria maiorica]